MAHTPDDIYKMHRRDGLRCVTCNKKFRTEKAMQDHAPDGLRTWAPAWWKDGWPQRFPPDADYALYVELGTRVTGAMLLPPPNPFPWAPKRR